MSPVFLGQANHLHPSWNLCWSQIPDHRCLALAAFDKEFEIIGLAAFVMITWLVTVTCGNQTWQKMNPFPTHSKYGENYSDANTFGYTCLFAVWNVCFTKEGSINWHTNLIPNSTCPMIICLTMALLHPCMGIWMNRGGACKPFLGREIMPVCKPWEETLPSFSWLSCVSLVEPRKWWPSLPLPKIPLAEIQYWFVKHCG